MNSSSSENCYSKVVFLGGSIARASVRIRCLQIAEALGCDYLLDVSHIDQVPKDKQIFVCVKPNLSNVDLIELSQRGSVVWDVHDFLPPNEGIDLYIVGSKSTAEELCNLKPMHIIPQHHCNFSEIPNRPDRDRKPAWIGRPFWCPNFDGLDVDIYNANELHLEGVIATYRQIGICLNLRRQCSEAEFHVKINDGIKLLNCMAFGIPSVSSKEPAYFEHGENCTIFVEKHEIMDAVRSLQTDDILYNEIRVQCIEHSKQFHLKRILPLYRTLLDDLLS